MKLRLLCILVICLPHFIYSVGKKVESSNPKWSRDEWRNKVDEIYESVTKNDEFSDPVLDDMVKISEYAVGTTDDYFSIHYMCRIANILDKLKNRTNEIQETKKINSSIKIISNIFEIPNTGVTDLHMAQHSCDAISKFTSFMTFPMHEAKNPIKLQTKTMSMESLKINSQYDNVVVLYYKDKNNYADNYLVNMKVYDNKSNFNFIRKFKSNVYMATLLPKHTSKRIVITTYNITNSFISTGFMEGTENIEKLFGLYFVPKSDGNGLKVEIPLNREQRCYKNCILFNHVTQSETQKFCKREKKSLSFAFKSKETISMSIGQTGINCTKFNAFLSYANLIQISIPIGAFVIKHYFFNDKKNPETINQKIVGPETANIILIFYQLTCITIVKYLFMLTDSLDLVKVHYVPEPFCIALGVLGQYALYAEFYFVFFYILRVSSNFKPPDTDKKGASQSKLSSFLYNFDFWILNKLFFEPMPGDQEEPKNETKSIKKLGYLTCFLYPIVPIILAEIISQTFGVLLYDRNICFPTITNILYLTTLFLALPGTVVLGCFGFKYYKKMIDTSHKNRLSTQEQLTFWGIFALFLLILLTWIFFILLLGGNELFLTLFVVFGFFQSVTNALLMLNSKYQINNTQSPKDDERKQINQQSEKDDL